MEIRSKILRILIEKRKNNDDGDGIIGFDSFGELEFEPAIINTINYIQNKIESLQRGHLSEKQDFYLLITRYEDALREYKEKKKEIDKMFASTNNAEKDIIGTARQSTLAFYYMRQAQAFPRRSGEDTTDARFVRFLTGHNFDTIRKVLGNPNKRSNDKTGGGTKSLIEDLRIVINQFESIGFNEGIKLIAKDIIKLQNDIDTFKED